MKSTMAFLLLFMVVLMAQPSEGFLGFILQALPHVAIQNGDERKAEQHLDQQHLDQDNQLDQEQQWDQMLQKCSFNIKIARNRFH
uniref:Uncharacterized protein n=1 Tax=Nothobranchius furzeri TaxID=105023 RepID=A0A8C6KMR9_NOTFU